MMNTKMINIASAFPALQKLASVELPLKLLYSVSRLLDKIEPEMTFYNSERDKLIIKYGEREDDGAFKIKQENMADFEREMNDLFMIDVALDVQQIVLPMLDGVKMSYNEMKALECCGVTFDEDSWN